MISVPVTIGALSVITPDGELHGAPATMISTVVADHRDVGPGSMYACLRGATFDGHDFAADAVADGAAALLVDHHLTDIATDTVAQLVVDDTRVRLGPIAAAASGHPSDHLVTVGVTGTNGKTTTTHLVAAIFEANGWPTGQVGTLYGSLTTPEAPSLQQRLSGFVEGGKQAAALEVSSHALALHRVDGTTFDAVVFTNLGRDHLDLHGTQEEYFRAKARLFDRGFAPLAVINVDDPYGQLLADASSQMRVVAFAPSELDDVGVLVDRHRYRWRGVDVEVPLGGRFNVANSLAALTAAVELGVPADVAAEALREVGSVPGRFDVVVRPDDSALGITVVVDYAHTPDGLQELLTTARAVIASDAAVVAVVGAGGERDQEKRPEMGAIAAQLADRIVVTSDNPRREDPQRIIDEIVAGIRSTDGVSTIVERRRAIEAAIQSASPGDIVVIAGKGHERTQDLGDRQVDFDDRAIAVAAARGAQEHPA